MENVLANRIVELRKKNQLTQQQLAEKLNVTPQAVSRWEKSETAPDTSTMIEIAKIFNVSLDNLIAGKPEPEAVKVKPKQKPQKPIESEKIAVVRVFENADGMVHTYRAQSWYTKRLAKLKSTGIITGIIQGLFLVFIIFFAIVGMSDYELGSEDFIMGLVMSLYMAFFIIEIFNRVINHQLEKGKITKINGQSVIENDMSSMKIKNGINIFKIIVQLFYFACQLITTLVYAFVAPILFVIVLIRYINEIKRVQGIISPNTVMKQEDLVEEEE